MRRSRSALKEIRELKVGLEDKIAQLGLEYNEALQVPVRYEAGNIGKPTQEYLDSVDLPLLGLVLYGDGRGLLEDYPEREIPELHWAVVCENILKRRGIMVPELLLPGREDQQVKAWESMIKCSDSLDGQSVSRLWSTHPYDYAQLLNAGRIVLVSPHIAALHEPI